jgi:hypothetical protein
MILPLTRRQILEDGSSSSAREVRLHFAPRPGVTCSDAEPCTVVTAATEDGFTATGIYSRGTKFTFYSFSATIPLSQDVSSFNVEIVDGGKSVTERNGGSGFPIEETLLLQHSSSCLFFNSGRDGINYRVSIAVSIQRRECLGVG